MHFVARPELRASTSVVITLDWFPEDGKSTSCLVQKVAAERSTFYCKKPRCEVSAKPVRQAMYVVWYVTVGACYLRI